MNRYQLFQSVLMAVIRYFDTESTISDELRAVVEAFSSVMSAGGNTFNPISPSGIDNEHVTGAIYFTKRDPKDRAQLVCVSPGAQGGAVTQSYNVDAMLAAFLASADPVLLDSLRKERDGSSGFSLLATMKAVLREVRQIREGTAIHEEVTSMFDDIRTPSGIEVSDDVYYRRKHNTGDYTTHVGSRRANIRL